MSLAWLRHGFPDADGLVYFCNVGGFAAINFQPGKHALCLPEFDISLFWTQSYVAFGASTLQSQVGVGVLSADPGLDRSLGGWIHKFGATSVCVCVTQAALPLYVCSHVYVSWK